MFSQQILTKKVLHYLRQNFGVKLQLPNLSNIILDNKVTLKYLKNLKQTSNENRYRVLMNRADQLLKKNLINIQKIKIFSQDLFQTLSQDIFVLQENEQLRKSFQKIKDNILLREEELQNLQNSIEFDCIRINDKQDILAFIETNFRNYLLKIKVVEDHYNSVNSIQVCTSINIDELYQESIVNDDDYTQHFEPLLQVLQRLKSNMIKLYQQIFNCDPYDIPLKSVNFLANCKNLLTQLQPFLINNDCAFNRLIFTVVKGQKSNLQAISNIYQKNLSFSKQSISDIFKSFFLGYMFQDYYRQIQTGISNSRQIIYQIAQFQDLNQKTAYQKLKKQEKNLQKIKQQIKQVKRIISIGKDRIMKQYVRKKQCKKLSLIMSSKQEIEELKQMIVKIIKYAQYQKQTHFLQNKQYQDSDVVIKEIKYIEKSVKQNILLEQQNSKELSNQERFKIVFIKVQKNILQVSLTKAQVQEQDQHCKDSKIKALFLYPIIKKLKQINQNYVELQSKLLNSYQNMKQQKVKLQKQSHNIKSSTLEVMEEYFGNLKYQIGFEICNEDAYCEEVKTKIMNINKAQYMIKHHINPSVSFKEQIEELQHYRSNLQWLLVIFQGSMDEKIFQMMLDKLDFQCQDHLERSKKVTQLIKQITKYIKDLKNILKTNSPNKIHPKVLKIIKDRIQLYEVIEDVYIQCNLVFSDTKKLDQLNVQNKGVWLFQQKIYQYVLMVYQFKNKIRTQIQQLSELLLPNRTKNYLIDQLYQPFSIKFNQYLSYTEKQLLNLTLRLEHALNIQNSNRQILKMFQQKLLKPFSEDYFLSVESICNQLNSVKTSNDMVLDLQNQNIIVHNLTQFKQLVNSSIQYYQLAALISRQLQKKDLKLSIMFKNQKLNEIKQNVLKNWNKGDQLKNSSIKIIPDIDDDMQIDE